ncbi:nitroreductase family protein [Nocardia sp. CA-107356]|uniref:nitroreductase family protein n=1 Tax=Nocardia sp. CA-107356 TaxID=3239972 RepID=UPI003D947D1F
MSPTSLQTNEFTASIRILDDRWTCRQFKTDQIPRDTIEALLRLAQRTPSWCNTQPWQVVLTEGAGTDRFRNELLEHVATATPEPDFAFPAQYTGAYVREPNRRRSPHLIGDSGQPGARLRCDVPSGEFATAAIAFE